MDVVEVAGSWWAQEREDIIMKYEKGHRAGLPEDKGPKPFRSYNNNVDHLGIVQSGQPPFQGQNSSLTPLQVQPEVVRPEVWGPSREPVGMETGLGQAPGRSAVLSASEHKRSGAA
ncbi:hypothetical protein G5576_019070 [Homo sapiens]|uniref:TBC1 domain family member 3B n=1 Tax=Homo sapiens TaxID=9606 RepID=A0A087WVG1_HUMAN|nr:TBC1 domain family member 3B [Homo sapiens]KAI2582501.1 hypothetical protein KI723_172042 [Homo sapiens]KAI4048994.1 TBC1 domain family member 3B [Homo sapiens]KAI4052467.1 hypothetical protein G5576_019070 [Homo sapiens]